MKRALIDDLGRIAQVAPPGGDFPVAPPMYWVDCPDDTEPYVWTWDADAGQCAAPPPPSAEERYAVEAARIERERDAACVADVHALGRRWQADHRSQSLLASAITLAQAGLQLPPVWRDADNQDMPVTDIGQLLAIAAAIAQQTQAAYAASWKAKEAMKSMLRS